MIWDELRTIDLTAQLAPIFFGIVVLLLLSIVALVAIVDPGEAYGHPGNRRALAVAAVLVVLAVSAVAMFEPEIARALRVP